MDTLAHERVIILLEARRNTRPAISKLPDEILCMVFLLAKPSGELENISDWLRGAHLVCHQWRALILSSSGLWSYIYLTDMPSNHAIATRMLAYSKDVPLEVVVSQLTSIESPDPQFLEVAKRLLDQIHRIKSLVITSTNSVNDIYVLLPPMAAAPLLRVLKLNEYTSHNPDRVITFSIFDHPSNLHSLCKLVLSHVRIPDELPLLPTLRSLSITARSDQVYFGVTMTWLLKALRSTPNLQTLYVWELASEPTQQPTHTVTVELQHVQFVYITFADLRQSIFFEYVNIPTSASITASFSDCHLDEPLTGHLTPICTLIQRVSASSSAQDKVSICLPTDIVIESGNGRVALSITLPKPSSEHASEYEHIFASVSPMYKRAKFSASPYVEIPSIPDLLFHFHNLKTISLPTNRYESRPILRALIEGPNGTLPPCSSLEYLEFLHPRRSADERTTTVLDEVILGRRRHNIPIKKVFVCEVYEEKWKAQSKYPELFEGVVECTRA
ncbi:hypothetical protein ONZ45_g14831 [Pleurotus djamor]|nr:hypothetical protein ONZ45_g14831 [Pleurotus djamor]